VSLKKRVLSVALWSFWSFALAQPAPRVEVALSPAQARVGDRVEAVLTLRVEAARLAGEPRFPFWSGRWGEAEVLVEEPLQKSPAEGGAAVYRQRLVLAAFRPGKVALPPAAVAVPLREGTIKVQTPAGLAIDVVSVLPKEEENPAPKPPAAPRSLPVGERFWWTLAALLAACLLVGWLLWRRRRAAAAESGAAPLLPPFEELAGELERLAAERSVVQAHTRLSFALRRYLGRVLPFPAVESTTSEVQRQLLSRRMPGPLVRQTVELLRACDLVKFARQEVGEERTRERVEAARRIAGEVEALFAPREPEKLEAAG
jgi:hypothetical protein